VKQNVKRLDWKEAGLERGWTGGGGGARARAKAPGRPLVATNGTGCVLAAKFSRLFSQQWKVPRPRVPRVPH
jgi:hypothetical protein